MSGGNNRSEEKQGVYNLEKLKIMNKEIEINFSKQRAQAQLIVYTLGGKHYVTSSAAKSIGIIGGPKPLSLDGKLYVELSEAEHRALIQDPELAIKYKELSNKR